MKIGNCYYLLESGEDTERPEPLIIGINTEPEKRMNREALKKLSRKEKNLGH